MRVRGRTAPLRDNELGAVWLGYQAAKMKRAVRVKHGVARDRRAAGTIEHRQHRMLGDDADRRRRVNDGGERASRPGIIKCDTRCGLRAGRPLAKFLAPERAFRLRGQAA